MFMTVKYSQQSSQNSNEFDLNNTVDKWKVKECFKMNINSVIISLSFAKLAGTPIFRKTYYVPVTSADDNWTIQQAI